ncbi:unnamed protein product [Clavelina lepadiformis]|uniref:Trichoplein keratin filament-binding protein n=1 Tax=Clavelina lepadiformis TaxID=159417 RepID=A0ABP0GKB8_CLALP
MALPTIPSPWALKHQHVERQLSRIHEQHQKFRHQWDVVASYYKGQNMKNNIRGSLTSDASYRKSMDAYATLEEKNRKATALHKRRMKLQKLLCEENLRYEAELQRLSAGNYSRLQEMQERSENLKSAREEKRKQLAQEKLYEHWKENNPELRMLQSEIHREHVKEAWGEQTQRKQEAFKKENVEEVKYANQYEEARIKALEEIKKKEAQRLQEEKERARILQQQMAELKAREQQAALLQREEEEILREQWELEKLQEERGKVEEQRKKGQLQRFLHHQYKAQLRRRAQQIQEELEFDREILRKLQEEEKKSKEVQTARQQKAKEDVEWMKQVLEQQLKLEKEREAELDLIYREEARRVWEQREEEWRKERLARERLMAEVLGERSQQMKDRAEDNRQQQQELLHEREELLLCLEDAQHTARKEKQETERRKQMRHEELDHQMTEREHQKRAIIDETARVQEREKKEKEEYERAMSEEVARMKHLGFVQQRRPRSSRLAWD